MANPGFSEDHVEQAGIETLKGLGWRYLDGIAISPDGAAPQRTGFADTILTRRFDSAVRAINPGLPDEAIESALRQVLNTDKPNLLEENRRLHKLITDGVGVEYRADDGSVKSDRVWLVDFDTIAANDWLVTNQFTVVEGQRTRRPDLVCFLNGLPVAVVELKNPGSQSATLTSAYNQLQTYKEQVPSLFRTNAVLVTSDGMEARIGSLSANEERFMPWRTVTGEDYAPPGTPEQDTLLRGVFDRRVFLDLIRDFTVFGTGDQGLFKIVAGYHQYHGAKKAVRETIEAVKPGGDRKIGVIWHTQGSGKSFLMAFFAGLAVKARDLENPTLLVLTDRNDLDDQLFGTFSLCSDLIRQAPKQATSREDLKSLLDTSAGGVIFSTVQKFSPMPGEEHFPLLTDRRNVIIIADEAHRSQYGLSARIDADTGVKRYGYAHYIRQALPNASFIGFTGTPIEGSDVNTPAIFGDYIDVYDISRAVEDGATVPIYYESRLARIELDADKKPLIDAEIEALTEDDTLSEAEKFKAKWSNVEALVGSHERLQQVAADLVTHLEKRIEALDGKAMAVCMSRRICVALYNEIVALRPDWHSEDDEGGAIKIVMSGAASDPLEWQQHIGGKRRSDALAKRARDPSDPLKLVIVRDMWLTGFDAPCMNTMYVDKPMRGHGLMQAIARVNRVFKDKPGGLIVDYIGIAQNLRTALADYSDSDKSKTGIDEEDAVAALQEYYERVSLVFHGFDYSEGIHGTPLRKLAALAGALDWVLRWQEVEAGKAANDAEKKKAHRAFNDLVLNLSKAYALAAASDYAATVRDEVGFFQAVRATLNKKTVTGKLSAHDRAFAVQQLIDQAVASSEIVDVLRATGLNAPDISILSDEFLAEVAGMKQKNLALEALKKLLNGAISARSRTNHVEARTFSARLEDAVARYHANAISALEMIQELIALAKDLKASQSRGLDLGLSPEEIAFYDALAENESAVEAMGDERLRVIAHELLENLRSNATVDWHRKESARARMRILVKRILKKYGYPPDLSDEAVQTVLAQAEILLREVGR
ncbi:MULTISPECIES: type I restriction endonuclease subunit R [unclassified Hyphomonas]|jgi:type I restriction enzyme R subunit|uniref:type I restriction endonuclease subunit R n=1 Tax=unclassified Hyphomonas TaxID=2630699 RepID=UPI000C39E909|nr:MULTISPECIES: type I restriction endonuclease subunit R [unclassified Hyphomonas]MAL44809.1 DEAD/DEAH box helicase [Hyphomonas sp.]MAX83971.1 DEAD/DEAH box helicase [Hyphomonas sp.]HAO35839.1 DEAD/DEAH box helicase [Hyphomonas sp.]HBN93535.1 DEAD/DEAH box helicase [Hyphomonas sp.]HBU35193.1 DEAD/DEAH box helicase [Hyphomonas sp.]|tara:strand:+ start:2631 stop:5777 length:3147 start_codon:yes stop_codon:yes gene_type:complete